MSTETSETSTETPGAPLEDAAGQETASQALAASLKAAIASAKAAAACTAAAEATSNEIERANTAAAARLANDAAGIFALAAHRTATAIDRLRRDKDAFMLTVAASYAKSAADSAQDAAESANDCFTTMSLYPFPGQPAAQKAHGAARTAKQAGDQARTAAQQLQKATAATAAA